MEGVFSCPANLRQKTRSFPEDAVKKVVSEEIASLPDKYKTKNKEYLCYCLRSASARARTYFGTTCDLVHRIRQHNGLIVGGARATSTTRPWRVALVVHGFSDRSAALRFEWFCKQKHSKKAYFAAKGEGANSIERRAALIAAAVRKCPEEKTLEFYYGDPYLEQCCSENKDLQQQQQQQTETTPDAPETSNNKICFVAF